MARYVELHARSAFSFLQGASTPEELIATCSKLKMPSMALLDQDGLYGAARFHLAGKKLDIKAHIGAEITVQSPTSKVQLQPRNKQTLDVGRGTLDFSFITRREASPQVECGPPLAPDRP